MLYFRENELQIIRRFQEKQDSKAMAIYGRRRIGKTELVLNYMNTETGGNFLYYQCTGTAYASCLQDFIRLAADQLFHGADTILSALTSFKDVFTYLEKSGISGKIFVIDEFPFLAKNRGDVPTEFQWIIDHGLGGNKLILLGSHLSFMKSQICDAQSPLYGRFDEIIELSPFTFREIQQLFPSFEDAVNVYAQTGGVAQYVMFYLDRASVSQATAELYFSRNGRMFQEAGNMLMQELRDTSTYVSVLRAIGGATKEPAQIASRAGLDSRAVYAYLEKLSELGIVSPVNNSLSVKKKDCRYRISDLMFRFHYTFIEPNISMITAIGEKAVPYILDEKYSEFLGFVYEDIIRERCYEFALSGVLPFMPQTVGKWWGNMLSEGNWIESEIDVLAYNDDSILLGECKYRSKKVGLKELDLLKGKAPFVPVKGRKVFFLLAGKSGFTDELLALRDHVILIEKAEPVV